MRIIDVESRHEDGAGVLEATVEPQSGESMRLFYRVRGVEAVPEPLGDALVVGLLAACMHEPEDLELDVPVSRTLLDNLVQAQDIFASWFDNLHRIEVKAPVYDGPRHADQERGVACCFTSGVDSLYTLRKHLDEVTHLFLVRGMDVPIDPSRDELWELIHRRLSVAASELDRPLITVETNLREIVDKRHATWGRPHPTDFWGSRVAGSTLASAALVLQGSLRKLYVPGSYTYKELFPWSSHPLLDPLWSTSDLESVHHGCEAARLEKVGAISDWSGPLRHLRVCYLNSHGRYNCGKCEKCLRTLVALRLHGVRDKLDAFDKPLSLKRVRRALLGRSSRPFWKQLYKAASDNGDTPLIAALAEALNRRLPPRRLLRLTRHWVGKTLPPPLAKRLYRVPIG